MKRARTHKMESLRSWDEFIDKITEPQYNGWAFRGQADSQWRLMSTLGRYLNEYVEKRYWQRQEERIKRIFS